MLELSLQDARRLLARYHLAPTDVAGAFERLGSVQYDPLKPVGSNHDLVLQARVPHYRVGDWEKAAYRERLVYDAWDKQASLVRMQDWPVRRIYHRWHETWWRRVLEPYPDAVEAVLKELYERGPLASTDVHHQVHKPEWQGSWYGPKLTKHVLRALWHTGRVVTHHRRSGKHVYDLAERVVPPELFRADGIGERESLRWLILLRHQAVGLLRPGASHEVWSVGAKPAERKALIAELVEERELVSVDIEGKRFHALPAALESLEAPLLPPKMHFLAPLDQLLWDRKAVQHIFGFEYVWEVYKPQAQRRWGYYVLPVFYKDRFVARVDSRLSGKVWTVHGWWWEEDVVPDAELLGALEEAAKRFMRYLGAESVQIHEGVDARTRQAIARGAK